MSGKTRKITTALLSNVAATMVASGLTFEEGLIMYRAAVFLMEEVNRNPDIDDDMLAEAADRLVEQELQNV